MDYTEAAALLGKEISDDGVKAFLDKYGIKYPKKDTISAAASDWDFGLGGSKIGMELTFKIDVLNPKYTVRQAERKGIFKPILTRIFFHENSPFALPFPVSHSSPLDELKKELGEPALRESPIYSLYIWNIMLDKDRDIYFYIDYRIDKRMVSSICIGIEETEELLRLYWTPYGETIESALENTYVYDKKEIKESKRISTIFNKAGSVTTFKTNMFFVLWAIDNGYLFLGEALADDIEKVREQKMDVAEFAVKAFKDEQVVSLDHFVNIDRDFVRSYYLNLYEKKPFPDWYYGKDFNSAFSKFSQWEDDLKYAHDVSKLQFSPENRRRVSEFVNKRYVEFQERKKATNCLLIHKSLLTNLSKGCTAPHSTPTNRRMCKPSRRLRRTTISFHICCRN